MVGAIVSAFLICWFPFAIMFAGAPFSPSIGAFFVNNNLEDTVTWLGIKISTQAIKFDSAYILGYFNSCLNPFIYACMNNSIRSAMKKNWRKIYTCFELKQNI